MRPTRVISESAAAAALLTVLVALPAVAPAAEPCCFANFRFAGGCQVVPSGDETCQSILAYLNRFDTVGRFYCGSTTVRGGWSIAPCTDALNARPQTLEAEPVQTLRPVQPQVLSGPAEQPQIAAPAQGASLIRVAAPLRVRFDEGIDPTQHQAGTTLTGTLAADLVAGDTVIAPAGSTVRAQLVPTSFWSEDSAQPLTLQATEIEVGGALLPINATAALPAAGAATAPTGGAEISLTGTSFAAPDTAGPLAASPGRWMELFNGRDAEGLAALYAEDAVMLPPNEPAIFGRDAIRAGFRESFAAHDLKADIEALEIVVEGDLAYVAGRYRIWTGAGTLVDRGKYLEIWRAVNGQWLIFRDIHNSSLPTAAPKDGD